MTTTYHDTRDIETAARLAGSHFFDPDTMRFFRSRVGERVYNGRFFVTSEQNDHGGIRSPEPRRYTVRVVIPAGRGLRFDIDDCGGFQAFASSAAANSAAERIAAGPFTVRHDPYPDTPASRSEQAPAPGHYEWRCYSGDVPIGTRNTRYAARRIRADLERAVQRANGPRRMHSGDPAPDRRVRA